MIDYQKIADLYAEKIKIENLLSDPNLSLNERKLANLIIEGKRAGMTAEQIKEWFIKVARSPFTDQSDIEMIEILEKLASDTAQ